MSNAYDLVLEKGDFPAWAGAPLRSIVVCSHPRSGSTLLGEAMRSAGGLGCPLEYLHQGFRPGFVKRWETPDLSSYLSTLHRRRTAPNGTFSTKLFWQDLEETAHERDPDRFPPFPANDPETTDDATYRQLHAELVRFAPNPRFAYLQRRDRVRQAVSVVVASQTGLWREIPGVGRREPIGDAVFDYERIQRAMAFADHCKAHWARFFAANGIVPLTVDYEDLMQDYARVVASLLGELGADSAETLEPRMRRQGSARSEAMVLQFLREHARQAAG